jgi:hypothetical protein
MTRSNFEYTELKSELQEIRILSIMKGHQSAEIECSLKHVSLMDGPNYEALSYTWGDPSDTSYINLHGRPFSVTKNLATALPHLRKETEVVEIWIDAICINQRDTDEKSVQVRRMREIYEKARKVIIWLGPESDDSGYAMNAINSIDRRWAKIPSQSGKERLIAVPILDKRALQAVVQLLRRSWWYRVWIIQEATCDNITYLKCGTGEVEFLAVVATVNVITQHLLGPTFQHDFSTPPMTHFNRVIALDQFKLNRSRPEYRIDILSLLEDSRICEASDPRDRVFVLSGFAATPREKLETQTTPCRLMKHTQDLQGT